jgi:hypothetical protein
MMEQVDVTAFHRNGFAVIRVLSPEEAARYAVIADDHVQAINMGDKRMGNNL